DVILASRNLSPAANFPREYGVPSMRKAKDKPGRMSAQDTLELWQQYKRTGDSRIRDRLVLTFAPMVKYIVYKKAREIPARCEVEDFILCGLEALIRSIDRYDPNKGATLAAPLGPRHQQGLGAVRRPVWAQAEPRGAERVARHRDQGPDHPPGRDRALPRGLDRKSTRLTP